MNQKGVDDMEGREEKDLCVYAVGLTHTQV